MEIVVGKTAGFCYGVQNAVSKTEELLKDNKTISCLGELVHNGEVIKKLEKMGLNVIENIENADDKVIIRAHGIPKEIYNKAQNLNIEIFDYTCPNVLKIHKIAEEYEKNGYFIFLIGKKEHPEIIGTISFCGSNSYILEKADDIPEAMEKFNKSNINKLLIIAQTTFSLNNFEIIVETIKNEVASDVELEIKNTICNATKIRQEETNKISKEVECMIIIGGKNSSNTKKLYDIAKNNCPNSFIVENKDELPFYKIKSFEKIGIMAGASTPGESIKDIIEILIAT
ncbi:MAG: 4-hydroxy-3-methylbut-2-enyl diphosphate reductase [Clostridia bacterium]|nr:4-hydroxy-3-methylbut-2-enyl diphosphate reductase [Clostridia bacterium]